MQCRVRRVIIFDIRLGKGWKWKDFNMYEADKSGVTMWNQFISKTCKFASKANVMWWSVLEKLMFINYIWDM